MQSVDSERFFELFSKERMESYKDTEEYLENLRLVQGITPKLQILEVFIRNAIDCRMSQKYGDNWIALKIKTKHKADFSHLFLLLDRCARGEQIFQTEIEKIEKILHQNNHFSHFCTKRKLVGKILEILKILQEYHNQKSLRDFAYIKRELICILISRESLGFWVEIIRDENLNIFSSFHHMKLEKYNGKPRDESVREIFLEDDFISYSTINLLRDIRNRAFHLEKLTSTNGRKKHIVSTKIQYTKSRIKPKYLDIYVGIRPNKLKVFIDDFLKSCNLWEISELVRKIGGDRDE